jgi:hypothetical protein
MRRKNTQVGNCIRTERVYRPFRFRLDTFLAAALAPVMTMAPMALAMPDLKIAVKTTVPNRSADGSEKTIYIQNVRKRVEEHHQSPQLLWPGGPVVYVSDPSIVTITRCDLDQISVLNLDDREYMATSASKSPEREALLARAAKQPRPAVQPQPTLLIETTTKDTGERREMFGYTARHVVTTRKQIPLPEEGVTPQENVTDGWYVDLDTTVSCDRATAGAFAVFLVAGKARKMGEPPQFPVLTFKNIGNPERGLALATKELFHATLSSSDRPAQNIESVSNETHVTELSREPLDPSLFEVPKNFRKVSQIRRLPLMSYWTRAVGWFDYFWTWLKRALWRHA